MITGCYDIRCKTQELWKEYGIGLISKLLEELVQSRKGSSAFGREVQPVVVRLERRLVPHEPIKVDPSRLTDWVPV
jgi:hypothetical protein